MGFLATRVTVGTTPTALNTSDTGRVAGSATAIRNLSGVTVYIGGGTVTTAAGFPVDAGGELALDYESSNETLYAIVAADTAEVAVLRAGV